MKAVFLLTKPVQIFILCFFACCYSSPAIAQETTLSSTKDYSASPITDFDIPAYLPECKGKKNVSKCTSEWIKNFVFREVKGSNFKVKGGFYATEVDFIIDSNGEIKNIHSIGTSPDFNREAERVANKLPSFIPAKKDGKNVAVKYNLPITLQIKD